MTRAIRRLTCRRCGHRWYPRQPGEKPKRCPYDGDPAAGIPACRSPYWQTKRKEKA